MEKSKNYIIWLVGSFVLTLIIANIPFIKTNTFIRAYSLCPKSQVGELSTGYPNGCNLIIWLGYYVIVWIAIYVFLAILHKLGTKRRKLNPY